MNEVIPIPADDYAKILAENIRLRDKLLGLAKECSGCEGTGCITVTDDMQDAFGKVLPCPDCADIRAVLE